MVHSAAPTLQFFGFKATCATFSSSCAERDWSIYSFLSISWNEEQEMTLLNVQQDLVLSTPPCLYQEKPPTTTMNRETKESGTISPSFANYPWKGDLVRKEVEMEGLPTIDFSAKHMKRQSTKYGFLSQMGKANRAEIETYWRIKECQVQEDEVVDSKILPYCSIDKKEKKSLGELEQEFLQALQAFYYEGRAIMSNDEFDNLKEELMWEGSSIVMLTSDEQKFLEASMAYVAGKPIMSDEEYDKLKMKLKMDGSDIVVEGPRCSLRSRKVYSDLSVDYFKMFLLNVPAALIALTLFFFLDDLTGFEITYLLELPEPFSFIFTWFAALPLILWLALSITNFFVKDFLILRGPCPNCGTENVSFFGTILSISNGGSANTVKCSNCGTEMVYDSNTRLITLPERSKA
ncbi:PGR5-like protein 1B, chloroplastic [Camellia sinensis]|uniref:PGR5-like protein 1B, chloroplastic n=1 Tax=Camellia sinensis TaxID=4442 RepID=UPI00103589A7|nr:PGR5-like protein 1B, chloroplastic [Camellia sinensis]